MDTIPYTADARFYLDPTIPGPIVGLPNSSLTRHAETGGLFKWERNTLQRGGPDEDGEVRIMSANDGSTDNDLTGWVSPDALRLAPVSPRISDDAVAAAMQNLADAQAEVIAAQEALTAAQAWAQTSRDERAASMFHVWNRARGPYGYGGTDWEDASDGVRAGFRALAEECPDF